MRRVDFTGGWEFSQDGGPFVPVVLPHDAMLGAKRGPDAPAGSASGYHFGGRYRYRKHFPLPSTHAGNRLLLEFEGVYRDAKITVNGRQLEAPPYGFVPFFLDVTGVLCEGENLMEVAVDTTGQPDCRWYSGAGIHRPVWLWEGGPACILPEGVRVTTLSVEEADQCETSNQSKENEPTSLAQVRVEIALAGAADAPWPPSSAELSNQVGFSFPNASNSSAFCDVFLFDSEGITVATTQVQATSHCAVEIPMPNAHLWSADHPELYRCRVELRSSQANYLLDEAETAFGIRTLEWGARGLLVNGRETLLRGGCIHCDNGILGAASWPAAERRRVRLLKKAGFNAIRVAHNPASAALLRACDELGMYVMDETWDMWYLRKSTHDYARHFLDWCDFDLRRLVARDYNHPSVIMYSIGNELSEPITAEGVAFERTLVDFLHSLDSTRPVTCGFNLTLMVMERAGHGWYESGSGVADQAQGAPAGAAALEGESGGEDDGAGERAPRGSLMFNLVAQASGTGMTYLSTIPGADRLVSPALDALDIAGYNYAAARYKIDARKHSRRVIVGSETFPHELARNWRLVESLPTVIGDFMWAAWDYLGEAGAGSWAYTPEEAGFSKPWPWMLAGSGALDILGVPGAPAALAGAVWGALEGPSIQVRPVNRMSGRTYKATWRGSDAVPSWSWRGCEGAKAEVEVYSARARQVRLQLNGRTVGVARVHAFVARFKVEYQPGTLVAIELDDRGCELANSALTSASGALRLRVAPERARVPAGSIAYVPVEVVGENGEVESNADDLVTVTVEGGKLLAFGSAQPAPTERYLDGAFTTYRGRTQAVVYRDCPGEATLIACASTYGEASATIEFT